MQWSHLDMNKIMSIKSKIKSINCLKIIKSARLALVGLSSNKVRTSLSVLGIVIGVASVIVIVSVGQGLQAFILGQLSAFGTDIVSIEPKLPGSDFQNSIMSTGEGVVITSLKSSDAEALRNKDNFPYITTASGYSSTMDWIFYEDKEEQVFIVSSDSFYPQIDAMMKVESGTFFTEEDNAGAAKVVLIGKGVAKEFFDTRNPIGENIKIKNENFKIIGVLQERGAVMSFDMDKLVIMPLKTSQTFITGVSHIQEIGIKLEGKQYLSRAKSEIKMLMRQRHDIEKPEDDDFQILTMDEMLTTINSITGAISALLGLLAAISLIVGGIGIMNIMLVIVAERTKEIGLRKALGAKYKDIMRQFVFEAIAISLIGGFIGIIAGVSFSFLMTQIIVRYAGLEWPFVVSYSAIIISFVVAAFFGVVFGWYPAKEAAQLSPIEALRKG
jgi:putative ABC transport system permease protein